MLADPSRASLRKRHQENRQQRGIDLSVTVREAGRLGLLDFVGIEERELGHKAFRRMVCQVLVLVAAQCHFFLAGKLGGHEVLDVPADLGTPDLELRSLLRVLQVLPVEGEAISQDLQPPGVLGNIHIRGDRLADRTEVFALPRIPPWRWASVHTTPHGGQGVVQCRRPTGVRPFDGCFPEEQPRQQNQDGECRSAVASSPSTAHRFRLFLPKTSPVDGLRMHNPRPLIQDRIIEAIIISCLSPNYSLFYLPPQRIYNRRT
jgi:hypothetical protein